MSGRDFFKFLLLVSLLTNFKVISLSVHRINMQIVFNFSENWKIVWICECYVYNEYHNGCRKLFVGINSRQFKLNNIFFCFRLDPLLEAIYISVNFFIKNSLHSLLDSTARNLNRGKTKLFREKFLIWIVIIDILGLSSIFIVFCCWYLWILDVQWENRLLR